MARPTQTASSARTITLPAFLAVLLKHHLDTHDHSPVFPNAHGGFLWRHGWRTGTFNPAFDGNHHVLNPPVRSYPIRPGLTFHELRHSHKTWLITAGIPEIAQARRLGHRLDKPTVEAYSHVTDEVEARIQAVLKQAWLHARHTVAKNPTPPPVTQRAGCIRRHLASDYSASHPAGVITGSTIDLPQPRTPTCANTVNNQPVEDQIWSAPPQKHPIFDQASS